MAAHSHLITDGSTITKDWLENYLLEEYGCPVEIAQVSPLSDVLGMMSIMRRITLRCKATDRECCLPETMIIKFCVNFHD
ncbi:unnamed protein product, partial [Mesorhabditis belari]|uniref:Uncharacterized protein n=1 Tax=Mesorhabditis belari TaxID=2138241 RepID=A0AAF3F325_9BILA